MIATKRWVCVCAIQIACWSVSAKAGENASEDATRTLVAAMGSQHLEAIAAPDPANGTRFIAALLIPGAQLLVVEADYQNAAELQALIQRQQYRDVYTALQQPATQQSRILFLDAGCDGLKIDRDTVDVVYERGTNEVLLDGDWKKAKLPEAEYQQRTQNAVTEFTRAVTVLRDSIAAPGR